MSEEGLSDETDSENESVESEAESGDEELGAMPMQLVGGHTVVKDEEKKSPLVPDWPFTLGVFGKIKQGKTTAMLTLVLMLMFKQLFCYARHFDNIQYRGLRKMCEQKSTKGKNKGKPKIKCTWRKDLKGAIKPEELENGDRSVVIFDDQQEESAKRKQVIRNYISNGRQKNASSIVLLQNRTGLPKASRANLTCLMLFKGLTKEDLKEFWTIAGCDIPFRVFCKLYYACTKHKYYFFYVDIEADNISAKYRSNFDGMLKTISDPPVRIRSRRNLEKVKRPKQERVQRSH